MKTKFILLVLLSLVPSFFAWEAFISSNFWTGVALSGVSYAMIWLAQKEI